MRRMVLVFLVTLTFLAGTLGVAGAHAGGRFYLRVLSLSGERGLSWRLAPEGKGVWDLVLFRDGRERRFRIRLAGEELLVEGEGHSERLALKDILRVRKVHGGHRIEHAASRVRLTLPGPEGSVRILLEVHR